jgi:hypothetical protein
MGGWVYSIVAHSTPGVVKIGATERDPTERLREANACTWHLPDYAIAWAVEVEDGGRDGILGGALHKAP